MFATHSNNKAKTFAEGQPKRADAAPGGKDAPDHNSVWQSLALSPLSIHPKLAISQPNDPCEQEADHIADQVMRMPATQQLSEIQKNSLEVSSPADPDEIEANEVAQKIVDGQAAEIHGGVGTVNRKGEGSWEATPDLQSQLESSKGGGQPLDDSTRSEMESKMGADFSGVKIHTGSEAHRMGENINAKAFTHGRDVFFKQGEFETGSLRGKELLAHELVHTRQQQPGVRRQSNPDAKKEEILKSPKIESWEYKNKKSDKISDDRIRPAKMNEQPLSVAPYPSLFFILHFPSRLTDDQACRFPPSCAGRLQLTEFLGGSESA